MNFRFYLSCFGVLCSAALLQGCQQGGVSRANVDTSINVRYGVVESVQQVELKSNVAKGAVAGGILGAVIGHNSLGGAAVGAASGALLTKAAEGSNKANSYQVKMSNGQIIKVVTESGGLRVGDCASVEQGRTTNIRFASSVYCEHSSHPGVTHPAVSTEAKQDASVCDQAKQQALQAKTSDEIDVAVKKVRALCES